MPLHLLVRRFAAFAAIVSFVPAALRAAGNVTIPFQAVVKTTAGSAVSSATPITFSLYTAASGGTALWTETQNATPVSGLLNVQLGSVTPLSSTNVDQAAYVGITVGSDAEMTPRIPLGTVPKAVSALAVPYTGVSGAPASLPPSGPAGGDLTGSFPNPAIAASAVDNTKLAGDSASLAKITGGVFTITASPDIVDQQQNVATAHLNDGIQSFTAGLAGALSAIEIYFTASNTGGSGTLRVYTGDDVLSIGTLVSSQSITVASGGGWQTFRLPTPIPITSGEVLSWQIQNPTTVSAGVSGGDPYPGGRSSYMSDYDFTFRTHVATVSATVAAPITANGSITASGDVRLGSSGQYSVAATDTDTRIVAGQVNGDGTAQAGSGFTVSRASDRAGLGQYRITFTTPFTTVPTIAVTPNATAFIAPQYYSDSTSSVEVFMATQSGYVDAPFHFIAIGGR